MHEEADDGGFGFADGSFLQIRDQEKSRNKQRTGRVAPIGDEDGDEEEGRRRGERRQRRSQHDCLLAS